jgi:hypothetical protein
MKIILTDAECLMLKTLGGMRSLVARSAGVKDAKMGDQNGLEADIDGLMGEYAFCKWKNIFPDLVPAPRSGSCDCVFKNQRIDIKTTRYKTGRLLATLKNNQDIDIYVLAILEENIVNFVGWAKKEDLCQQKNIKNLGHGDGYSLDQNELRSFN